MKKFHIVFNNGTSSLYTVDTYGYSETMNCIWYLDGSKDHYIPLINIITITDIDGLLNGN